MTDLELTIRAKHILDQLANGINPYTEAEMPDNELLNDPRLIRCFFHVSKKLGDIIANGGDVGKRDEKKLLSFKITEEEKKKVHISQTPVYISHFVDEINKCIDISIMKKCKPTSITEWLVAKEFLNIITVNGKKKKTITTHSSAIGIIEEDRLSAQGFTYKALLYSADAQRFILDNINEIFTECDG